MWRQHFISQQSSFFDFSINRDFSVGFSFSIWLVLLVLIIIALIVILKKWPKLLSGVGNFEIDKGEFGLGSGKISFKPNNEDRQIAYSIWVELSTRKIGISIDLDHDVIVEVYDSWYNFFSVTRELIKNIPVSKIKSNGTEKIILLSIEVLNEGLRPHLTKWQARFRHWYENEIKKQDGNDIDPQIIQAKYPKFRELKEDLLAVNKVLINYRKKMHELVIG